MTSPQKGAYGFEHDIVDYILGITYEIWEERGVDLIHQYYSEDCVIWGLDGITRGAGAVVDATHATLEAFPDRRLLGEDVPRIGLLHVPPAAEPCDKPGRQRFRACDRQADPHDQHCGLRGRGWRHYA